MTIRQATLLQQYEETCKEIEQLTRRILLLDRALIYSSARRALDRVHVPGGLEAPEDQDRADMGALKEQHSRERAWRRTLRMADELSPLVREKTDRQARAEHFYTRGDVLEAIGRDSKRLDTLQGALDWLEHEMVELRVLPGGQAA